MRKKLWTGKEEKWERPSNGTRSLHEFFKTVPKPPAPTPSTIPQASIINNNAVDNVAINHEKPVQNENIIQLDIAEIPTIKTIDSAEPSIKNKLPQKRKAATLAVAAEIKSPVTQINNAPLPNPHANQYIEDSDDDFEDIEDSIKVNFKQPLKRLKRISVFESINSAEQEEEEKLTTWIERVIKQLRALSDTSLEDPAHPFKSLAKQWVSTGNNNARTSIDGNCELCDKEAICYEFEIRNIINDQTMIVGSSCINHFASVGLRYQAPDATEAMSPSESAKYIKTMVDDLHKTVREPSKVIRSYFSSY